MERMDTKKENSILRSTKTIRASQKTLLQCKAVQMTGVLGEKVEVKG